MILSTQIMSLSQQGLLLAAAGPSQADFSNEIAPENGVDAHSSYTVIHSHPLNSVHTPNKCRPVLYTLCLASSACSEESWGGAAIVAFGLGVVIMVNRFRRRYASEWQARYQPFGQLEALHKLIELEEPSLQGALAVFWDSCGPRRSRSLITFNKTFAHATRVDDERMKDVNLALGMTVYDWDQYSAMTDSREVNRYGAQFARTFIEMLREIMANSQSEFDKLSRHDNFTSRKQMNAISFYLGAIRAATNHFLAGLDAMTTRDLRFVYYREVYGMAFTAIIKRSYAKEYTEIAREITEGSDRGYEARLFLNRTYQKIDKTLSDIETSLLDMEES